MWNGTKVAPVGSFSLPVVNPKTNEKYKVRLLVVKENLTPLLELNGTQKMKLSTDKRKTSLVSWRMQMMISKLSGRMFLTNVSEHFQEKFTYKVTQIATFHPSSKKRPCVCSEELSSKKSSKSWDVLRSLLII